MHPITRLLQSVRSTFAVKGATSSEGSPGPGQEASVEARIHAHIGMTSLAERDWWMMYASEMYTGRGALIDLGCWLGSTTASLAAGLSENPLENARLTRIQAFDRFEWRERWNGRLAGTAFEGRLADGDDFRPLYLEMTAPFLTNIECVKADLRKYPWHGGDIEFLLIDAMKSWELCNAIHANFYPSLVPGLAVILHQDFAHYFTYWIHLRQYRLREYFKPFPDTMGYNSIAFAYISRIPSEILDTPLSIDDFPLGEIDEAFAYSSSLVAERNLPQVEAAHIMAVLHKAGVEAALPMTERLAGKWGDHEAVHDVTRSIAAIERLGSHRKWIEEMTS